MKQLIPLLLTASTLLRADTLILKNGTQADGIYLGGDARTIKFDSQDHVTSYSVSEVELVRFGSAIQPSSRSSLSAPAGLTVRHAGVELMANTPITVRLIDPIHSDTAAPGSVYRASLDAPLYFQGRIVVPGYSSAVVQLIDRSSSGHLAGKTTLALALTKLVVNGAFYEIQTTEVVEVSHNRASTSAKITGGTAAAGAVIGALAGGGRGAAIGAGSGAAAGAVVSVLRPGQKVTLSAETKLIFRLAAPLTITFMNPVQP